MRHVVALSFSDGIDPEARARLATRARAALEFVVSSSGGSTARLVHDESDSDFWVGVDPDDRDDLWERDSGRLALFLSKGPYTYTGSATTGASLLARLGLDESVLGQMAAPFAICLRRGRSLPMELLTDACGLGHVYVRSGRAWTAGSSSSLALALLDVVDLDREAVQSFALTGNYDGTRTPFRDVVKVPNGHRALLSRGGVTMERYIEEELAPPRGSDTDLVRQGVDVLRGLVEAACSAHDEPPTLELSGGIDSRGLLAAMTEERRRSARMLTLGTPGSPDWVVARDIAAGLRLQHQFIDLRELSSLDPGASWALVERSAFRHDASSSAIAAGVLDWVESQVDQGPRFNGINGEYARGRFYAAQRSGLLTEDRVRRLARWRIFANDAADPWLFGDEAVEQARVRTIERLQEEFASYGSDWLRATDDHFLYGRMQRWCGIDFSASGRERALLAPYFCSPFLVWARRLDEGQKRSSRLFSSVIEAMDPDLAGIPLVTGFSPKDLARPRTSTRIRQAGQSARRIGRKVRQRVAPGTDTPPVGAAALSRQVLAHWVAEPNILEPLARTNWLDPGALEAVVSERRTPSTASVALVSDLLVIAKSMAALPPR